MEFGKTYEARLEQKRVETQTSYQEYEKLKLWALSHTFAPALL